jgi:hypothetical protein
MRSPHHRSTKRRPKPDRRRALELLATSPDGCTEALLFANDFTIEMLLDLLRAGLVSATPERMMADDKQVEVARLRLTEEGWRTLNVTKPRYS